MCPNRVVIQVFVTKGGQGHRELETVLSLSTNNGLGPSTDTEYIVL